MYYSVFVVFGLIANMFILHYWLKILEKRIHALSLNEKIERFVKTVDVIPDRRYILLNRNILTNRAELIIKSINTNLSFGLFFFVLITTTFLLSVIQGITLETGLPVIGEATRSQAFTIAALGFVINIYTNMKICKIWYKYTLAKITKERIREYS